MIIKLLLFFTAKLPLESLFLKDLMKSMPAECQTFHTVSSFLFLFFKYGNTKPVHELGTIATFFLTAVLSDFNTDSGYIT